jgi:hypothetical protein
MFLETKSEAAIKRNVNSKKLKEKEIASKLYKKKIVEYVKRKQIKLQKI